MLPEEEEKCIVSDRHRHTTNASTTKEEHAYRQAKPVVVTLAHGSEKGAARVCRELRSQTEGQQVFRELRS